MDIKENKIFNLMDTNGRRSDFIDALSTYTEILDRVQKNTGDTWGAMPNSTIQYEFYKEAIRLSTGSALKEHPKFDALEKMINNSTSFRKAMDDHDMEWIRKNKDKYANIISLFDNGIEDRARHYSSNLNRLGFADKSRNISQVGRLLIEPNKVKRDILEKTLPIDSINIIYLRQLLKLRIFDDKKELYYSPFNMALYILLKKGKFSEKQFFELVQGLNPYYEFSSIDTLIDNYNGGDIVNKDAITLPNDISLDSKIEEKTFKKYFRNQKTGSTSNTYWNFYELLYNFSTNKDTFSLNELLDYYESKKPILNKAFGKGRTIFVNKKNKRPNVSDFVKNNEKIFNGNINENLYIAFLRSKKLDSIREYSDTTKRVFKATGLIKFDNGFVELAYKELCECIFKDWISENKVHGNIQNEENPYYTCFNDYEGDIYAYFCQDLSLCKICEYGNKEIENVTTAIRKEFKGAALADIPKIIAARRKEEFAEYIDKNYPADDVKNLLRMFSNRDNDIAIQARVSTDATVPTIYEYVVGIAWYYFSGKRIDLLSSFNLTLTANFEPLIHAGGGQGDIVIYEKDKVVMLEATLMNANSQKRGEWEPVLRHSVNLKVEEESNNTGREVTSFFVADEFDNNTINIWKAVSAVPMESSLQKGTYTDNVVIMPINSVELSKIMDKAEQYDEIIKKVRELFDVGKVTFDLDWRDRFISELV